MTNEEFYTAREALGLTRSSFARAFGVTENAVGRWETGHAPLPRHVEIYLWALRLHLNGGLKPEQEFTGFAETQQDVEKTRAETWTPERLCAEVIKDEHLTRDQIVSRTIRLGLSKRLTDRLIRDAWRRELVEPGQIGRGAWTYRRLPDTDIQNCAKGTKPHAPQTKGITHEKPRDNPAKMASAPLPVQGAREPVTGVIRPAGDPGCPAGPEVPGLSVEIGLSGPNGTGKV
jgi:transcriptional regulator with XRE-family HTH domain